MEELLRSSIGKEGSWKKHPFNYKMQMVIHNNIMQQVYSTLLQRYCYQVIPDLKVLITDKHKEIQSRR